MKCTNCSRKIEKLGIETSGSDDRVFPSNNSRAPWMWAEAQVEGSSHEIFYGGRTKIGKDVRRGSEKSGNFGKRERNVAFMVWTWDAGRS